ncbi:hypothetical protein [Streptomyces pristinaespiralis]|uniref:hypothetical protein n=1 Tax=Streptomyces pristinaespiralis TaxID=38300 RepID=UPI0033EA5E92
MATTENDGTSSSSDKRHPVGTQPPDYGAGPLLTAHATLVFVAAAFIGVVVGWLTYVSAGDNAAAAVLAGLMAGGMSAPMLHKLIGA